MLRSKPIAKDYIKDGWEHYAKACEEWMNMQEKEIIRQSNIISNYQKGLVQVEPRHPINKA